MSIQTEITRILNARNIIRTKLVELGLVASTSKIETLATAIDDIDNRGAVQASVQEGDTYTIPKGYHNGSGTVSGVSGGGDYSLQSKSITPTKKQQNVTPDSGFYGLSDVTVAPIPDNYNDTSVVTAGAAHVLANMIIVNANGETVAGTMANIGTVNKTLDCDNDSYIIPAGYHHGNGKVQISKQSFVIVPNKTTQEIEADDGKVISKFRVESIPAAYQDITGTTATPGAVLTGYSFVDANGVTQNGSMPNNGTAHLFVDGLTVTSVELPLGYYHTGTTVELTADIENALAAI